jgi:hypothetical protein
MSHSGKTNFDSPMATIATNISSSTATEIDDVVLKRPTIFPAESFITPGQGSSAFLAFQGTKTKHCSSTSSRLPVNGGQLHLPDGMTRPPLIPESMDALTPCPRMPLMPRTVTGCPWSTPAHSYLPAKVQSAHVEQAPHGRNMSLMDIDDGDSATPLPYLSIVDDDTVGLQRKSLAMKSGTMVLSPRNQNQYDIIFRTFSRRG